MSQALTLERISHHETHIVPIVVEISNRLTRISQQRIKSSKYSAVRSIQCEVREGILYLSGQVSSYYLKQLAQEAVRSIEGVGRISNCVEVAYSGPLSTDCSDSSSQLVSLRLKHS